MGIMLQEAKEILEVMLKFSTETKQGRPFSLAVLDAAGILVGFNRMDGASPLTARMAINKAYTAIDWRRNTKEVQERLFSGETKRDVAWFGEPRHAPIPGGVLLKAEDGTIVGALGSSGRTAEEDEEVVQIGAQAYQEIVKRKGKKK